MTDAVKCKKFENSDNLHYKYDLFECKKAHERLVNTDAHKQEPDELLLKSAWAHLDAYVWRILSECHYLIMHVQTNLREVFLTNFMGFIEESTKQLNETKHDMETYITMIEHRTQHPRFDDLPDLWKLQKLITFTEGSTPYVAQRDWYIQPFAFALHTSAGPREGGSYATFAKARRDAHIMLTRMQKL
jgi:hypothetical protein